MAREFQTGPEHTQGGQRELIVEDKDVISLLSKILKELQKIRIHFELINDEEIDGKDL